MPAVAALIPHYNRRDLLERLLPLLAAQTHPFSEILVIDNGSLDDSVQLAERLGARVLPTGFNAGFSRAVNRGIRETQADLLAVLNNDVEPAPDWLERLLHAVTDSDAWFATGKIYLAGSQNVIDATFDLLTRSACAWRCGKGRPDGPSWNSPRRIWSAPFTAALFRRRLFDTIGLLDEDFESYLEDAEFGLRCALAGCEGLYVPDARAWHRGSATLGLWHSDTVRRLARNQLLLVAKHYPRNWLRRLGWAVLAGQVLWCFVALRHGAGWACLRGKLDGLRSFRRFRRRVGSEDRLIAILRESEQELHRLQQLTGFDWFWRLYFAFT